MSMLKRNRLYKDANNIIYHVRSDGSIITYPDFKIITTVDEKALFPEPRNIKVHDHLYLDIYNKEELICVEDTWMYRNGCCLAYDIFNHEWFDVDIFFISFHKLPDFVLGYKYEINGTEAILERFDVTNKEFRFVDECETYICVKSKNACVIQETNRMPEQFTIWKTLSGNYRGMNLKTRRLFDVSEHLYLGLKAKCYYPKRGDIVYINDLNGIWPYQTDFVQRCAKELRDNTLMMRYAYGYYPSLDIRDYDKKPWKVLYTGINSSLIEEHCTGERSMVCVCDNESLTVLEDQEEDAPF